VFESCGRAPGTGRGLLGILLKSEIEICEFWRISETEDNTFGSCSTQYARSLVSCLMQLRHFSEFSRRLWTNYAIGSGDTQAGVPDIPLDSSYYIHGTLCLTTFVHSRTLAPSNRA